MTPLMNLFLRCMLAIGLVLVLWTIADYSMAATAHAVPDRCGPQGAGPAGS